MEGMGLKFTPVIGRRLLRYSSMFGPMWLALLGPIASPNSPNGGFGTVWDSYGHLRSIIGNSELRITYVLNDFTGRCT